MTVAELIVELQKFPPGAEVVAPDSEEGINSLVDARVIELYYRGNGHYVGWSSRTRDLPKDTVVMLS